MSLEHEKLAKRMIREGKPTPRQILEKIVDAERTRCRLEGTRRWHVKVAHVGLVGMERGKWWGMGGWQVVAVPRSPQSIGEVQVTPVHRGGADVRCPVAQGGARFQAEPDQTVREGVHRAGPRSGARRCEPGKAGSLTDELARVQRDAGQPGDGGRA